MNKSLFTLATLSAFAAGAYAQSSVTLFGVLDVNAAQIKNGSAGSLKSLSQGALNTSRLGLRGSEDLGGGLSAGFHLEGQVNPDNGTMTSVFWNRRSTVSLIGSWGELRLGRDYNPSSRNTYLFEPYIGTSVGTVLNFTLAPTATLGSGATTALRTNNAVAYFLPKGLGGLYGEAMIAPSEGAPGNKYFGGRLGYAAGPFDVSAAYGTTKTASSDDFKQWNIGLAYKLDSMKLLGLYNVHEFGGLEQKTTALGLAVPVGLGEFRAMWAANSRSGGAVGSGFASGDDSNMLSVGYVYNLSKRTALYGFAGRIANDGAARLTVDGTAPAAMAAGETSSGYQFGITHRF
jgi:predicted porin